MGVKGLLHVGTEKVSDEPEKQARHHDKEAELRARSFLTETLPLAGAGDLLAPGVGQILGYECAAIGVRNPGTADVIVAGASANTAPEGFIGPNTAVVPSGSFAVLHMPGSFHAFYGRARETVEVTRYEKDPGPVSVAGRRRYFDVDLGTVAASAVGYTTPWGTGAVYGGFSSRELSTTALAAFRLRDGNITGKIIETISLAPDESTSDWGMDVLCTSPSIFVEYLSGSFELVLRVN